MGRSRFDAFITEYFNSHAFQSITTEEFLKYFNENLIKGDKALAAKIMAEDWIYKSDVPSNMVLPVSEEFNSIDQIQKTWRQTGVKGLSSKIKSTTERQHFIDYLPSDLNVEEMKAIDAEFNFTHEGNFVIKRQWFVQAIRHQYTAAYPTIEKFMIATSRTGSLQTLYKEMIKTAKGKSWAKQIFEKAKPGYHLTTIQDLQKTLQ